MNTAGPELEPSAEDALILGVQGGDLHAFEPLVDLHLPHVRAFLALRAPAAHLVDELAHETFVYAFRNMHRFEAGTSLANWLRAIAWNLLRAETQRFTREQANHTRYAQARSLDLAQNDRESVDSRDVEFLTECLEKLPASLRDLLNFKYHDELPSDEIARRLKRSTAWVWTALFRVRQQLRDCIRRKSEVSQPC